jgi:hypothetical protein
MNNPNLVRNFFADESMTNKECDESIKIAFYQKMSRSLCDSDDDKEIAMPKQSLAKNNSFKQSPTVKQEIQVHDQAKEFKRR